MTYPYPINVILIKGLNYTYWVKENSLKLKKNEEIVHYDVEYEHLLVELGNGKVMSEQLVEKEDQFNNQEKLNKELNQTTLPS